MDDEDVDMMDVEVEEEEEENIADESSMDWIVTPSYWVGWEGEAGTSVEGNHRFGEALGKGGQRKGKAKAFLVVDTNVLLGDSLERFKALVGAREDLVICIPWTVLCELDGLKKNPNSKSNSNSKSTARDHRERNQRAAHLAMKYLEHAFLTQKQRFLGQSLAEFKRATEDFGVKGMRHSNDDLILMCTLQKQRMLEAVAGERGGGAGGGDQVFLVTNDRNLLVKGKASGVHSLGLSDDFEKQLRSSFVMTAGSSLLSSCLSRIKQAEAEAGEKPGAAAAAARKALVPRDDLNLRELLDETLNLIHTCLSRFIEEGFKECFGEKEWMSMVAVSPPWSMKDVFKLIKQHWFALDLDHEVQSTVDWVQHVHERHDRGETVPKQTFLMFFEKWVSLFDLLASKSASTCEGERAEMSKVYQKVYQT